MSLMNRSLTIKTGQTHVQKCMRPLLERIKRGDVNPSFIVTHRLTVKDAPQGNAMSGKAGWLHQSRERRTGIGVLRLFPLTRGIQNGQTRERFRQ